MSDNIDFEGVILSAGTSSRGLSYSEETLKEIVDNFNQRFPEGTGCLGQIIIGGDNMSTSGTEFNQLDPNLISHKVVKLKYDTDKKAIIAQINFLNNDKGQHLIQLLARVPNKVRVTPIVTGIIDDDNNVRDGIVHSVGFTYSK